VNHHLEVPPSELAFFYGRVLVGTNGRGWRRSSAGLSLVVQLAAEVVLETAMVSTGIKSSRKGLLENGCWTSASLATPVFFWRMRPVGQRMLGWRDPVASGPSAKRKLSYWDTMLSKRVNPMLTI
jgi:hypothetical protein